jgi:hypothetical protein
MHHIISDGWSMSLLTREVEALYTASLNGTSPLAPDLPVQYADYAHWQRELVAGEFLEPHLAYWRRQLSGAFPVRELPTDKPRPAVMSYKGRYQHFKLSDDLSRSLNDLSRREGVTLFMTLLASFNVLLSRYINSEDVVIGSAFAGRNRSETENLIGFFVNMLILRTDLSSDPRFRELLSRVRDVTLEAYAHQDMPFDLLVDALDPVRDASRSPLFQVAFGLQNNRDHSLELPGLKLSNIPVNNEAVRYDLTVWMSEEPDGIKASWSYNTDLFYDETIANMNARFEALLRSIIADPDTRISDLDLTTEQEKRQRRQQSEAEEAARIKTFMGTKRRSIVTFNTGGEHQLNAEDQ